MCYNGSMNTTPEQVLDAVRKYIRDKHPGGANLEVVPEGVYQDREWWHVSVRRSIYSPKRFEYYEALATLEQELLKFENLIVLFVPTDPESEIAVAP